MYRYDVKLLIVLKPRLIMRTGHIYFACNEVKEQASVSRFLSVLNVDLYNKL